MVIQMCGVLITSAAAILLVLSAVLLIECVAAMFAASATRVACEKAITRPDLAVVVPAHNEADGIAKTLRLLCAQMRENDRLIVVADNCTDSTASVARGYTDLVIQRDDLLKKGKGYAIAAALEVLRASPPEVIVFVDADCAPQTGFLDSLGFAAIRWQCPVQASNLATSGVGDALSSFAFSVKNLVRPLGLAQLGLPCLLTGTGMAMSADLAFRLSPQGSSIVEDLQMSVDAAMMDKAPRYCPDAVIVSPLPVQRAAARSQRTRWEHGHLSILCTQTPRIMLTAVSRRSLNLLVMSLDIAIPPLSLLVMIWLTALICSFAYGIITGTWVAAYCLILCGVMLCSAISLAWLKCGRRTLPLIKLLSVPTYVLSKLPMYCAFVFRRQQDWIRTERDQVQS